MNQDEESVSHFYNTAMHFMSETEDPCSQNTQADLSSSTTTTTAATVFKMSQ